MSRPAGETLAALWKRWVSSSSHDELLRIDCVKGTAGRGKRGLTSVKGRRSAIARVLAGCPPGGWVALEELERFTRASANGFPVARDAWGLYIGDPQYGSFGFDDNADLLDLRYRLCVLLEYAATLGLLDVALVPPAGARSDYTSHWGASELDYLSRYDGLLAIRVTALGAYAFGSVEDYHPAPLMARTALCVQPNMEIVAIGEHLEPADVLALDAWATRTSDRVWCLEAGKLLSAAEAGRPVEEFREFLHARAAGALPGTAARLLGDVARRCVQVRDRGLARLLECEDEALAALLAHDRRTSPHCIAAGGARLVVPAASEAAFKRGLRAVGYLLADEDVG